MYIYIYIYKYVYIYIYIYIHSAPLHNTSFAETVDSGISRTQLL